LVVPEAQYAISQSLQVLGPLFVLFSHFGMLTAINFDDQFRFQAEKIGDIGTDGLLTPEFATFDLAIAQLAP